MVSTAAGLAAVGKIPFVNTFTVFLTTLGLIAARGQVCYGNLNVKFGGAYCGMSDALDGASHHALEDISAMRALPNMRVIVPSDAESTRWATKWAAENYGPVYLRLSRDVYPDLYAEGTKFELGRGAVVRDGTDVTVIACGLMTFFVPYYFIWSFIEVISNSLRGAGDALWPMVITIVGICGLRIAWIIFVVPVWDNIKGISMCYPVTWAITAAVFVVYYLAGKWLPRCITRAEEGK